ncbi:MAG: putative two-component system sensor kinase [Gemmatimonadetes bacterium]|nr:putative two-component system sensor kinase [Gemmatimonadota bacterium]
MLRACSSRRTGPWWRVIVSLAWRAGAIVIAPPIAAQQLPSSVAEYQHDRWLLRDGLPGTRVEAILQSPDGYLWFSTLNGLVRFDGVRFSIFDRTNTPALRDADAFPTRPLLVDRHGVMWIGTTAGLVQYEHGELRHVRNSGDARGANVGEIAGMVEDRAGTLWAYDSSTVGGLLVMRDGRFQLAAERSALHHRITALAADKSGALWIGTSGGGVVRMSGATATTFTTHTGLPDNFVTSLFVAADSTVWVGTERGFSRLEHGVLVPHSLASLGGTRGMVRTIAEARDGGIWLGTDDYGLLRWRNGQLSSYAMHEQFVSDLTDNLVTSVFVDREGTLWAGTGVGLDEFRTASFVTFSAGQGLPTMTPGALHWSGDQLWLAPKTGGLVHGTPGRFVAASLRGLDGVRVFGMAPGRDGGLWLSSTDGVFHYRDGTVQRRTARDGLSGGWVLAVLEDRDGRIWAGTLAGGVHRLDSAGARSFTTANGLAGDRVRSLLEDRQGAVWIGTADGISRVRHDSVTSFFTETRGRGPSVTSIYEDRRGRLWFGTFRGLARIVDGRVTVIDLHHGLPGDVVASITEDDDDGLWLSTSRGIVRISADEAAAVTEGRAPAVHATTFGTLDGLVSATPVWRAQPSSLRSPDGRLWFSTPRGLAVFDPKRLAHNAVPPPVRVEEALVDGQPVSLTALSLPPRARRLDLRYTGLSLRAPQRVRFRYRLEGFDTSWVNAETARSVSYTNLAPGNYRFRVVASNDDGVWNERGAALDFRVLPSFYQAAWFRALLVLAALLAGWGVLRLRQKQLERRFALVLAERNRMAREIHDTLLQGFTGITLQLQPASRLVMDAPDRAREHIDRILALADKTLLDARRAVWDMRAPALQKDSLAVAFEDVVRHAADGSGLAVRIRVVGKPRRLSPAAEMALFRIGQEAVANAVKHANPRTVDVELTYDRRAVRLVVRDDGRGFDPLESFTGAGGHWGLVGMRERADQAGAQFTITSASGRGTEIMVAARIR